MMGETAAAPYLQNHNTGKWQYILRIPDFRMCKKFNFRDPTRTTKLRESKAHVKISGNTVLPKNCKRPIAFASHSLSPSVHEGCVVEWEKIAEAVNSSIV